MNRCLLILMFLMMNVFGMRCIAQQQPDSATYFVTFHVIFDETNQPACDAEISVEGSDGSLVTTFTDSAGYCIILNLSGENSYSLYIDKYLCFTERFKIRPHDSCSMNTEIEIRLVPMVIEFIHLPVIQFDHGSARIKPDSMALEFIKELCFVLKENPTLVLQISGYTKPGERRGLAKKRALKIHQYYINTGINKERLVVNTQPARHAVLRYQYDGCHPAKINLYITKEFLKIRSKPDQQRIRQECRQVRFEIISTDYVPEKIKNE